MQTGMLFVQLIAPFTAQRGVLSAHGRLDKSYSCIIHNTHNPKSNLFMHIKQLNNINMVCMWTTECSLLYHIFRHSNKHAVCARHKELNSHISIYCPSGLVALRDVPLCLESVLHKICNKIN